MDKNQEKQLDILVEKLYPLTMGENKTGIKELIQKLYQLAIKEEELKRELSSIQKEKRMIRSALYDQMDEANITTIEHNGIKFQKKDVISYRLKDPNARVWDDSELWFNWLKENGYEDLIKIQKTVHHRTRDSFLREYTSEIDMETGMPRQLPDFIEEEIYPTIVYNKSAIRKKVLENEN